MFTKNDWITAMTTDLTMVSINTTRFDLIVLKVVNKFVDSDDTNFLLLKEQMEMFDGALQCIKENSSVTSKIHYEKLRIVLEHSYLMDMYESSGSIYEDMFVSHCVLNFDQYICECLDSIYAQLYKDVFHKEIFPDWNNIIKDIKNEFYSIFRDNSKNRYDLAIQKLDETISASELIALDRSIIYIDYSVVKLYLALLSQNWSQFEIAFANLVLGFYRPKRPEVGFSETFKRFCELKGRLNWNGALELYANRQV